MRTYADNYAAFEMSAAKEPLYVIQLSWDKDDTDHTYLTSSVDVQVPVESPPVDRIDNSVLNVTGQTQKINPNIATNTIGSVTIQLSDVSDNSVSPALPTQITTRMSTKLAAGDGLRGKVVRVYVGYYGMPFTDYDLRLSYIIDNVIHNDGIYKIMTSDIQRTTKHKIFTPQETTLNSTIDANALIIPTVAIDTELFKSVSHGMDWTVRPGETVSYVKIDDEVICHVGGVSFDTTNGWHITAIERGALNTNNVEHAVTEGATDNRKPKIIEHIYIEGAAPKVMYGLLTGLMHNYENKLTYPFDFSQWSLTSTPIISKTTDVTPVGWGSAYSVDDDDVGSIENIYHEIIPENYITGGTWTGSLFVKKETVSNSSSIVVEFRGTASSSIQIIIDASTGVFTTASSSSATIIDSSIIDFNDDWWFIKLSGYSTTVVITSLRFYVYPAVSGVPGTGIITVFGAALVQGDNVGMTALPYHWHLSINESFVRLSDFKAIGDGLWNIATDYGKPVRIESPGTQDGKRYIEKEVLLWMGCFMPIYSTGEIGLRKLSGVLSDASNIAILDKYNVVSYSDLMHDMKSVINDIRVEWNWSDSRELYTKENLFIDSESIAKHGRADSKQFSFKTVHTGIHTDESLLSYFDVLRDRYSGPPLLLTLSLLPSMGRLEVGDIVHVTLDQIRDLNTGSTLDRSFEVQQITTNWFTGAISVKLFGSSQKAGELTRSSLTKVLHDTFYTKSGTNLTGVLTIVAGVVTTSGTLTGHATDIDNAAAVYYFDGDLEIASGVTVSITENVQLRIKGFLQINGAISGIGSGATGGAATTQYVGGGTSDTYDVRLATYDPVRALDVDLGEQGYFGTTISAASLRLMGQNVLLLEDKDYIGTTGTGDMMYGGINLTTKFGHISPGESVVPWFPLTNDNQTNTFTGYRIEGATNPGDFRGNSGAGGMPFMKSSQSPVSGTVKVLQSSGAGGNGGAGLMTISRGMAFGGSGKIELSGGDSSAGGFSAHGASGKRFYAGSGAPGAPGALLIFLDGKVTNPDITQFKFIANYGSVTNAVGATELPLNDGVLPSNYDITAKRYTIAGWPEFDWPAWPYSSAVYVGPPDIAAKDYSVFSSAHRVQYIPEDETPVFEDSDASLFSKIAEYQYSETNIVQLSPPAINDYLGDDTDVTDDGMRMVAGSRSHITGSIPWVHVFRNIDNVSIERSISDPTASIDTGFGVQVGINPSGDRLYGAADNATASGTASSGLVHIYTRSGITWAPEQILQSSAPASTASFGRRVSWNEDSDKMLIFYFALPAVHITIEYFTRSGPTWTNRGIVVGGGAIRSVACEMSRDGNVAIFGDYLATVDGVSLAGEAFIYFRDGLTWTLDASLTPDLTTTRWGLNGSLNYDGSVIAFSNGSTTKKVAVYYRVGQTYKLIQILESPAPHASSTFGESIELSDNGLIMLIHDSTNDEVFIFRRENKSVAFSSYQGFKTLDVGSVSGAQSINLSNSGKIVTVGNYQSDLNANNAGAIYIWKTLSN